MANPVGQVLILILVIGMPVNPERPTLIIKPTSLQCNREVGLTIKSGFSLIEILVVLLIIVITLGFTLLAFGDFGGKRRITIAAEQFTNYIKLVQQQAVLETGTLGIFIDNNGYQVKRLDQSNHWIAMPSKSIFHHQSFPDNLVLTKKQVENNLSDPAIIINASGDTTPFTFDFGTQKQPSLITLHASSSGFLTLKHHD